MSHLLKEWKLGICTISFFKKHDFVGSFTIYKLYESLFHGYFWFGFFFSDVPTTSEVS